MSRFSEIKTIDELLHDYKKFTCCSKEYKGAADYFGHLAACPEAKKEADELRKTRKKFKTGSKYAFVTLIMMGDKYVPGGVILGHSLKMVNTNADRVCMVSGVSEEGIRLLKMTFDYVISVPLLKFQSREFKSENQNKIYKNMMHTVYTKWNCLMLEEYEKVFFIDCDTSATRNFDFIFGLAPPAAHVPSDLDMGPEFDTYIKNHSQYLTYGSKLPGSFYLNCINTTGGMMANILLKPNIDDYVKLKKMIKTMEPFHAGNGLFGGDEQSISLYNLAMKKPVTYLPSKYFGAVFWKLKNLVKNEHLEAPPFIHYLGNEKPWYKGVAEWPDIPVWWTYYYDLPESVRSELYKKEKHQISKSKTMICIYCKTLWANLPKHILEKSETLLPKSQKNHKFIENGKIVCPRINRTKL